MMRKFAWAIGFFLVFVAAAAASTCEHEGQRYYDGASICIDGDQYACDGGDWVALGTDC